MPSKPAVCCPRTIPGPISDKNISTLDWGANGFVAYGCGSMVVVVDPYSGQVIQTLSGGHKSPVTIVKFRSQRPSVSPQVQLISGDESGMIVLWDAIMGKVDMEFEEKTKSKAHTKPVIDLAWLPDGTGDEYVISLHEGGQLTMWDPEHGETLWTTPSVDKALSIARDHFDESRMCLVTESLLVVVDDLSPDQPPDNFNNKFNVSGPSVSSSSENGIMAYFSKLNRDILFLMFPREVLIMDLRTNQTIGQLVLERGGSAFKKILPCSAVNLIYCLHSNGTISARLRSQNIESSYEVVGQSDTLRLNKTGRITSMALNPMDDSSTVLLTSDGKLLFYQFSHTSITQSNEYIGDPSMLQYEQHLSSSFIVTHIVESIVAKVASMNMAPDKAFCGSDSAGREVAIGTSNGYVQIFDTSTCDLRRQYFVTSAHIRGVEWAPNSIICFCTDNNNTTNPTFRNLVYQIDTRNGTQKKLLDVSDQISPIMALKISNLGQYLIVLFQDQPFELWDIPNSALLKVMPPAFPRIAGLVWCDTGLRNKGSSNTEDDIVAGPSPSKDKKSMLAREHLVVTTHEGLILHFTVEGGTVRYGQRIPTDPIMGAVTCIARKGDWIVTGDSEGVLHFWDLKAKISRSIVTKRGGIKDIIFQPKKGSKRFLVLFEDGIDVWDATTANQISTRMLKTPTPEGNPVSIGWTSPGYPIVAYLEGIVSIYDVWLSSAMSPIPRCSYEYPIQLLAARNEKIVQYAKSFMQYEQCTTESIKSEGESTLEPPSSSGADLPEPATNDTATRIESAALRSIKQLPDKFLDALTKTRSIAERCLLTARISGDEYEYKFWTLFRHYSKMHKEFQSLPKYSTRSANSDVRQVTQLGVPVTKISPPSSYEPAEVAETEQLPSSFDVLCDASQIRRQQLQRLKVNTTGGKEKNTAVQQHVQLGQHGSAIQMLLETDVKEPSFYEDSLRACVIAAIGSPESCQNTIKLVAMNLIAAGKLDQGVELLCLVGCHLDACNYLQSEGEWQRAALLAKSSLHPAAYSEVLSRWVEHLQSSNKKAEAVLVCLSYGQWKRALAFLNSMNAPNLTVLFAEACLEQQLLTLDESGAAPDGVRGNTISARGALLQTVWMKAAKVAAMVGNRTLMQRYNVMFDGNEKLGGL